jgi:hypothetical protein
MRHPNSCDRGGCRQRCEGRLHRSRTREQRRRRSGNAVPVVLPPELPPGPWRGRRERKRSRIPVRRPGRSPRKQRFAACWRQGGETPSERIPMYCLTSSTDTALPPATRKAPPLNDRFIQASCRPSSLHPSGREVLVETRDVATSTRRLECGLVPREPETPLCREGVMEMPRRRTDPKMCPTVRAIPRESHGFDFLCHPLLCRSAPR